MKNKKIIFILIIIVLIPLMGTIVLKIVNDKKLEELKRIKEIEIAEEKLKIKNNYNTYVRAKDNIKLYNSEYKKIGNITKNTYIKLDDEFEITDKYYKLKNLNYYVYYDDVEKTEIETLEHNEYSTYRNYIPFNQNIVTADTYKVYFNDLEYIEINESNTYPIIIKQDNKYGIELNDHLVYINKEDVKEIVESNNSELNTLKEIAVLNYHFTIDANFDERKECVQSICVPDTKVDEQIKYLKDNNFYSTTMRDLYLFLNGNIQLPEKSVSITIDDGWYVSRMITILERYEMIGTLFLIGSLASPNDYTSNYLEIHSHTWDMHTPNVCSGGYGGGILCLDEATILEDLKKSRESLNNTTVFCYPFYENNTRSKKLLIDAGFEMAFVGGNRKATINTDLYLIPRYVINNSLSINTFINYVN